MSGVQVFSKEEYESDHDFFLVNNLWVAFEDVGDTRRYWAFHRDGAPSWAGGAELPVLVQRGDSFEVENGVSPRGWFEAVVREGSVEAVVLKEGAVGLVDLYDVNRDSLWGSEFLAWAGGVVGGLRPD